MSPFYGYTERNRRTAERSQRMSKKVILAYSGGLDTSVAIKWLTTKGYDVVAYMADVGQEADFNTYERRAIKTGAIKVIVEDLKEELEK